MCHCASYVFFTMMSWFSLSLRVDPWLWWALGEQPEQ